MTRTVKAKVDKLPTASEQQEQCALIEWANLKGINLYYHATGGVKSSRRGAIDKKMGLRSGLPDLALYEARGGYFGLFIELKQNRVYTPSQMRTTTWLAQEQCLTRLNNEHYYAVRCYGWLRAKTVIEKYLLWPRSTFINFAVDKTIFTCNARS